MPVPGSILYYMGLCHGVLCGILGWQIYTRWDDGKRQKELDQRELDRRIRKLEQQQEGKGKP